ncbi:hypothetical protein NCAS_0G00480 [Naumovozyma castellii]|uniref:Uncharacterized protein n=1 Tax=Naumovozyma castellii TaxID=27288 RepID=G0VHQ1_NAUCA|nr:hypothetical protein NCAS_0G00480 [Naumovozyma castellii CBS 4309]CCC70935.1 hypothetical protein NCAS_0G00480 [Naumovozyma castellii CBS 4309]
MTSLDDTIISPKNLMLLDNVTNYTKEAIDYFNYDFKPSHYLQGVPLSCSLLAKMSKHNLLRLPSCSMEEPIDYSIYLTRLHNALWRRWSINQFNLHDRKCNPLQLDWNKETDMTVLYGPDLAGFIASDQTPGSLMNQKTILASYTPTIGDKFEDILEVQELEVRSDDEGSQSDMGLEYASSWDSTTSSIFDDDDNDDYYDSEMLEAEVKSATTIQERRKRKVLFDNTVLRRDIDSRGYFLESHTIINDIPMQEELSVNYKDHTHKKHRHHHNHHHHHHHHHHEQQQEELLTNNTIIHY